MLESIIVPIAGMATGLLLFLPVIRAAVRITEKKLAGKVESEEVLAIRDEIGSIHDRLERLEYRDGRVAELEERLDFAERLLAQKRHAPRVEGDH